MHTKSKIIIKYDIFFFLNKKRVANLHTLVANTKLILTNKKRLSSGLTQHFILSQESNVGKYFQLLTKF